MNSENPWLAIPFEDYENHMSAENVGQMQALNAITKRKLEYLRPISLAILGCATGNGFEHVNTQVTKLVYGIDINAQYLKVAQERYSDKIDNFHLIQADLNTDEVEATQIDLTIAALVVEYLDLPDSIANIKKIMGCDGTLIVILQHSIKSDFVSDTVYDSMKSLSTISNNVREFDFDAMASKHGLIKINRETYSLNKQKEFIISTFRKG